MFYQEALPKFRFLSRVDSLLTIRDRHWRKVAATFEKAESANSLPFAVHFHMGAYKRDVVVVIKMGAYIHGVLSIPILRYSLLQPCISYCTNVLDMYSCSLRYMLAPFRYSAFFSRIMVQKNKKTKKPLKEGLSTLRLLL